MESSTIRQSFFLHFTDDNSSFDYDKPGPFTSDTAKTEPDDAVDEDDDDQMKDDDDDDSPNGLDQDNPTSNENKSQDDSNENKETASQTKPIFKVDEPEVNAAKVNSKENSLEGDDAPNTKPKEVSSFTSNLAQQNAGPGLNDDEAIQDTNGVSDNEDSSYSNSETSFNNVPDGDGTIPTPSQTTGKVDEKSFLLLRLYFKE